MVLTEVTAPTTVSNDVIGEFLERQTNYAERNYLLDVRSDMFEGRHWTGEPEEDTEFQLVLNYSRNVSLRFTAILSRAPKPRVPIPSSEGDMESLSANKREKLMMAVWPDLMNAWHDVETNASKLSYGVLQAIWAPSADQPETVTEPDGTTHPVYTEIPFRFRSIPPKNFYPVYRTFDRPNDFLGVFRHDPGRIVRDLEKQYDMQIIPSKDIDGNEVVSSSPICDVVEYWSMEEYKLIAMVAVMVNKRDSSNRFSETQNFVYTILSSGDNPYGTIPFWVLQNIRSDPNEDPTTVGSISDLDDIQNLNKHLNFILSEEAEEIAINIHRPLVYKSDEHLQEPSSLSFEPGATFPIGEEESLEPLQWAGEPTMVPTHINRIMDSIRDITFLGDAGFGKINAGVSGASMSVAMHPLQQIIELKLPLRIEMLQGICKFVLKCFEKKAKADSALRYWVVDQYKQFGEVSIKPEDVNRQYFVGIEYGNLLPRDDNAHQQNEVYKFKTGVQSLLTTLDNLGYDDPTKELKRIREEMEDPILNPEHVMMIAQAKQATQQQPPPGQQQPGQPQPQPPGMQQPGVPPPQSTGPMMPPGTAAPGTAPIEEQTMGGFGGIPGQSPPIPGPQGGGQFGAGQLTPFLGRGEPNA